MSEYRMPSLGADMDVGKVVKWLVAPGDHVHRGDLVAQVETDKAVIDAEIFEDGVIEALLVNEGELVPVGTPLARVATEAGAATPVAKAVRRPRRIAQPGAHAAAAPPPSPSGPRPIAEPVAPAAHAVASREAPTRLRASPMARRRARELGVDLATLRGSGAAGAIVASDVEAASQPAPHVPSAPTAAIHPIRPQAAAPSAAVMTPSRTSEEQQEAMRHAIGVLMARSKREIPHYYLETTIDFGAADAWLRQTNRDRPPRLRVLSASLLLKATALAARKMPQMNGFFIEDSFQASAGVHLGVAIALREGGLIAPAIHDVDSLSVDELTAQLVDLVGRARSGRLRSSEMADPTLTVTNLGDQGVEKVFGVIYPPQVALVGFGKIIERLAIADGLIGARPQVVATLSADHRVSDGASGARFLSEISRLLQHPAAL